MDSCKSSHGLALPEKGRQTEGVLLALLCAACFLEGGGEALTPATACVLNQDLGISLVEIGSMSLAQGLLQATCAPLWGIAASRGLLTRRAILTIGCMGWGICILLMGMITSHALGTLILLRAINGVMLACLTPICTGIVADTTSESHRGRVFGYTILSINCGKMAVAFFATLLSHQEIFGMRGWRVAFFSLGFASVLVAAAVALFMEEPDRVSPVASKGKSPPSFAVELRRLAAYFGSPTFCVIVAQGVFGSVPTNALGFDTMYFQVAGLGDTRASILSAARLGSSSLGNVLGGHIADKMARVWPEHGRTLAAQISVFSGIPLVLVIFAIMEPTPQAFPMYLALMMLLGLMSSWCGAGVNYPILSEIVEPEGRAVIVAWDRALEGASASLFGARLVATLAASVFGFNLAASCNPVSPDPGNSVALGRALAAATVFPWLMCLGFYTAMHWSYPYDLRRMRAQRDVAGWNSSEVCKVLGLSHAMGGENYPLKPKRCNS